MSFLYRFPLFLILAILAGCAGVDRRDEPTSSATPDRYIARDTSRTVDLTHPPRDAWDRIRRGFAIPNLDTDLSRQWTEYYASHPEAVARMAQRASKYLYFIVDEINRRGLPTELALLPFVESAYNPTALSRSQASGLWQFIPSTGEHYNLKQDWWRDERRDPIASTYAALDYLENLFEMQGDWYLALASYNWGEGAVQRAMARNEAANLPTDYLSLDMPDETRNYVPKLQAIKNLIANPDKYAVTLPPVENTPYFASISKQQDIDVEVAARLAEMPIDEFKALNPSFNRPVMHGEADDKLLLPTDRVDVFNNNLQRYQGRLSSWTVYQLRRGDTLATVAKRFSSTETRLRQINNLGPRARIAAGQNLLIPNAEAGGIQLASLATSQPGEDAPRIRAVLNRKPASEPQPAAKTAEKAPAAKIAAAKPAVKTVARAAPPRTHKIRTGDTLYTLARQYNTSVDALRSLNGMRSNDLKVGAELRIPAVVADAHG
jgi:membrane-bound lytic murein transglycosylase D